MSHQSARIINLALGIWLFLSAFLWLHTRAEFNNAWVVGLLMAAFAGMALSAPVARYLNTALAVWLFIATWLLPTGNRVSAWNNIIVAVLTFALSLVGAPRSPGRRAARPV